MYQSLFIYLLKGHLSCFQILTTVNSPGQSTGEDSCSLLQGNLPNPGIEPESLMSPALAGGFFTTGVTEETTDLFFWHIGFSVPNQGSNSHPLHWKCRVLTTGLTTREIPRLLGLEMTSQVF